MAVAQDSKIEWTSHTFNPWRGCTKVSAGCANCYAETMSGRNPKTLGVWGPQGTRVVAAESYWREPLKWDREAKAASNAWLAEHKGAPYEPPRPPERPRVFCASLADVFEDWSGPMVAANGEQLFEFGLPGKMRWVTDSDVVQGIELEVNGRAITMQDVRRRLFSLIDTTPNLDWLLLTKRPENVLRFTYDAWCPKVPGHVSQNEGDGHHWKWPSSVWLGTSVENRKALSRIDVLRKVPAAVRFLSVEPLLEDLGTIDLTGIHWVIVGGESGHGARPMHPDWARSLRDQCQGAGVAFFFKQWGEWAPLPEPFDYTPAFGSGNAEYGRALDRYAREHGASLLLDDRPEGWDAAMIRDGTCVTDGELAIGHVGKKAAGRLLDGREWNELPEANQ